MDAVFFLTWSCETVFDIWIKWRTSLDLPEPHSTAPGVQGTSERHHPLSRAIGHEGCSADNETGCRLGVLSDCIFPRAQWRVVIWLTKAGGSLSGSRGQPASQVAWGKILAHSCVPVSIWKKGWGWNLTFLPGSFKLPQLETKRKITDLMGTGCMLWSQQDTRFCLGDQRA